jgi:hypothetical protein
MKILRGEGHQQNALLLDVSLKLTAICIVDRTGKIVRGGVVTSDPETIAATPIGH